MALSITHPFVSAKSDGADATLVRPTNWNATHTATGTLDVANGGTGAATLTGLLQGNGTGAFTVVADSSTVGQVLRVTGAATYAWGALDLADADAITGDLPFANLTQGSALSVLGVTGNATADNASIAAGTDHQVLRRSGTALAFGAVNLAQAAAITGALPIGNGGTGQATQTAAFNALSPLTTRGDIIFRDATNNVRLAKGTAGTMLEMGADDPAWVAGAGIKLLTSGTFATASTLDFVLTSFTGYRGFKVFLSNVIGSADADLWMRTSTDAGSSYDAGASDYSYGLEFMEHEAAGDWNRSNDDLNAQMALGFFSTTNPSQFEITVFEPGTAQRCTVSCFGLSWNSVATHYSTIQSSGARLTTTDVDAFRFLPSTGTFSGKYALFGVK